MMKSTFDLTLLKRVYEEHGPLYTSTVSFDEYICNLQCNPHKANYYRVLKYYSGVTETCGNPAESLCYLPLYISSSYEEKLVKILPKEVKRDIVDTVRAFPYLHDYWGKLLFESVAAYIWIDHSHNVIYFRSINETFLEMNTKDPVLVHIKPKRWMDELKNILNWKPKLDLEIYDLFIKYERRN